MISDGSSRRPVARSTQAMISAGVIGDLALAPPLGHSALRPGNPGQDRATLTSPASRAVWSGPGPSHQYASVADTRRSSWRLWP
jgi:hypothetical protein